MANKYIAKHFKCNDSAILLAYLIDKEEYHRSRNELKMVDGEEFFFATSAKIQEEVNIGYKKQKKILANFKEAGFILECLIGIPAKLHFAIDQDKIIQFVTSSFTQKANLVLPEEQNYTNNNTTINKRDINNRTKSDFGKSQDGSENTFISHPDSEKEKSSAKKEKDPAVDVIEYFNSVTGQTRSTAKSGRGSSNVRWVRALLSKGYDPDEIKLMIDVKYYEWHDNPKMARHLNPVTLFKRHGEEYIEDALHLRDNPQAAQALKESKGKKGYAPTVSQSDYDNLKNW